MPHCNFALISGESFVGASVAFRIARSRAGPVVAPVVDVSVASVSYGYAPLVVDLAPDWAVGLVGGLVGVAAFLELTGRKPWLVRSGDAVAA